MRALALAVAAALFAAGCLAPNPTATLPPPGEEGAAGATAWAFRAVDGAPEPLPAAAEAVEAVLRATGHRGGEPNVGVTASGAIFVTAADKVLRSRDDGATWEVVYALGLESQGVEPDPIRNSDPMLWVDPWTDVVYNDPMWPILLCSSLVASEDDGETWFERHGVCHPPPMDHQRLGSGPPGPKAPPLAGLQHPTVLYQCYNQIVESVCASSFDGGLDWAWHAVVANQQRDGCGGTTGSPRAGPDGTVAVAMWCDDPPMAAFSEDNGLTWRTSPLPDAEGVGWGDPAIAWTPDGTVYVAYSDGDWMHWLARSTDKGATWDGPWRLLPPDVGASAFGAIVAGDDGRVAGVFVATEDDVDDPSDAPDATRWHAYVTLVEDAGAASPTFTTLQVTPEEDPVQVGCVWQRGFPGAPCRNLLDFIDAAVGPDGRFYGVFSDGCVEGCAGNPEAGPDDSRDRTVTLVALDGWRLRAS